MDRITEEALLELTGTLVSFPSANPQGDESEIAAFLARQFEESPVPFEVSRYEVEPGRPNVVARAGNPEHGRILLTGHTDVVPVEDTRWTGDPFELRREGDRIVGRGVADMKGALAAKLLAAEAYLSSASAPCEVTLAFVAGEETTGFGTEALVERGIDADAAILGEPTDLQACIAQKGTSRFEITIGGRSAHSGSPEQGVNAADGLPAVLGAVRDLNRAVQETDHPLLAPGSVTATEVHAGTAVNIVPDEATVTVDWRSVPGSGENREYFDDRLTSALEEISLPDPDLRVSYDQWLFVPPTEIDPSTPVVEAVLEAARTVGIDCERVGFNASTDARHLTPAGIPTVLLGPGTIGEDAHTVDESIEVADLAATARIYRRALTVLSGEEQNGGET